MMISYLGSLHPDFKNRVGIVSIFNCCDLQSLVPASLKLVCDLFLTGGLTVVCFTYQYFSPLSFQKKTKIVQSVLSFRLYCVYVLELLPMTTIATVQRH